MSAIPKENRILITSHDAFRYLGNSFSIDVVALQGISTLQEETQQKAHFEHFLLNQTQFKHQASK